MLRIGELAAALKKKLLLEDEEARSYAWRILNYFEYNNLTIDNPIDPQDRRMFRKAYDAGLLGSYWDTEVLHTGKNWRVYYWELKEEHIRKVANEAEPIAQEEPVYDELPDEAWSRETVKASSS